jgi:uncharacterized SAM-binding protein YcdF (DUF218 family)
MMLFGVLAAIAALVLLVRFAREPRRFGNAVWLGVLVVFGGLWLLATLDPIGWLQTAAVLVIGGLLLLTALLLPWGLIANGVVMWRREGHRPANLLSLAAGCAMVLLLAAIGTAILLRANAWLLAALAAVSLVACYLAFLFAALVGYAALYGRWSRDARPDAIIVLGAGLNGDRVPPLLAGRLDRAIDCRDRALAAGTDPVLVVSGGRGSDEAVSEASAMRGYLERAGVPGERILLEDRAATTEQNLRYSTALLSGRGAGRGRAVAVTSNYHAFRTAVLARRLGLPVQVIGARTASYFVPSAFLREFVALLAQYRKTNAAAILVLLALPLALVAVSR